MTCGIAIPVAGKVVLATGSRVLHDTRKLPDIPKILTLTGGFSALSAGTLTAESLALKAYRGMSSKSIDKWADLLVGLDLKADDTGVEFLVVREGNLWRIDTDGVLYSNLKVLQTIGSGADMAFGYIGASKPPTTVKQAEALALRCLKFVSQHMVCEGPPFITKVV